MSGFTRCILQDSFISHRRVVLECDEHLTVSGDNGAGKTSFLQLVPFFFGAEPATLVNQSAGKKNFLDYYLPRSTSLIVYEYQRSDGVYCVLVYRHSSGTKPVFRFVSHGYDENLFHDPSVKKLLPAAEVYHRLRQGGVDVSEQIATVRDYRAIIQNDRNLQRRSANSRKLRPLAMRYSLCEGNSSMSHIEKVAHAVLKRSSMFERMGAMIADIMIEDKTVIPSPPSHRDNHQIADGLASLRDFNAGEPEFRQVITKSKELNDLQVHLSKLARSVQLAVDEYLAKINTTEARKDETQKQIKAQSEEWDVFYREQADQRQEMEAQSERLEKEVDDLEQKRRDWDDLDIESKVVQLARLDSYRQRQYSLHEDYQALNGELSNLRQLFDEQKNKEYERHRKVVEALRVRIDAISREQDEVKSRYEQRKAELDKVHEAERDEYKADAEPQRDSIQRKMATQEILAKQASATEDEALELSEFKKSYEKVESRVIRQEEICGEFENTVAQAKKRVDEQELSFNQAMERLRKIEGDLDRLHQLRFPEDNTLLAALKQVPGWGHDIGKLLDPALYQRKDLSPGHDSALSGQGIFGWTLDLEKLNPPEEAQSEQELEEAIASSKAMREIALEEKSAKEKAFQSVQKSWKKIRSDQDKAKQELGRLRRSKEAARQAMIEKEQAVQQAVYQRREEAKDARKAAGIELEQFEKNLKLELESIRERQGEERNELLSLKGSELSELDIKHDRIKLEQKEDTEFHQEAIARIEKNLSDAASEKGIDEDAVLKAKQDWEKAKGKADTIASYSDDVTRYEQWQRVSWSHRQSKGEALLSVNQRLESHKRQLISAKHDHDARLKELRRERDRFSVAIKEAKHLYSDLQERQQKLLKPATEGEVLVMEPVTLIKDVDLSLRRQSELENTLSEGMNKVNTVIYRRGGGQFAELWDNLRQEIKQQKGVEEYDVVYRCFYLPAQLEVMLDEHIPNLRMALIEQVRAVGMQMDRFFQGLEGVRKDVQARGRQLTSAIDGSHSIDALTDIQIQLRSKVEDLEYWQDLKDFHEAWDEWLSVERDSLPTERLEQALQRSIDALKVARISSDLRSLFDFSISMKENGRPAYIRNDKDLDEASSNGLSYLAICIIFMGITRFLCKNRQVQLHWPIDELAALKFNNIEKLFSMLEQANITMVAGSPGDSYEMMRLFKYRRNIHYARGVKEMVTTRSSLAELIAEKQAGKEAR